MTDSRKIIERACNGVRPPRTPVFDIAFGSPAEWIPWIRRHTGTLESAPSPDAATQKKTVREQTALNARLDGAGSDGRLLIGSSTEVGNDVPLANYLAFLDEAAGR